MHPQMKILYQQLENRKSLNVTTRFRLEDLYPNTLYYIWLSARSSKGEGAHTTPIRATTDQYGKAILNLHNLPNWLDLKVSPKR